MCYSVQHTAGIWFLGVLGWESWLSQRNNNAIWTWCSATKPRTFIHPLAPILSLPPLSLLVIFSLITQSVIDTQQQKCTMHNIGVSAGPVIPVPLPPASSWLSAWKVHFCLWASECLKAEICSDLFSIRTVISAIHFVEFQKYLWSWKEPDIPQLLESRFFSFLLFLLTFKNKYIHTHTPTKVLKQKVNVLILVSQITRCFTQNAASGPRF